MLGAIMPMLLSDYSMGYDKGGMLLSFHSMGSLLASFIAGILPSCLGRKNSIIMLSSAWVVGFLGILATRSPLILMVMFLFTGIGRGGINYNNNAIVNDIAEGDPKALNLLHAFFAVGAFIAPFLTSFCVIIGLGWKFTIVVVILLALAMVFFYGTIGIGNEKSNAGSRDRSKSLDFLRNADFYLSCGILFFNTGTEYAVNGWVVTYLKDAGIMTTSLAQAVLSMLWIAIIAGRLFCGYISKYVDKRDILLGSSIGTAVFFVLFMLLFNVWAIIACIIGLGFCLSGIYPTAITNAGTAIKGSGLAMGILLSAAGLGGITMPYITGAVAEKAGIAGGMTAISVFAALLFVFTLVNRFNKRLLKKDGSIKI
jgi:fucose permease